MIRRILAVVVLIWLLGFVWFAGALPQPAPPSPENTTDAIVVPTGSGGRIPRGLDMLRAKAAGHILITGVDPQVRPGEFQAEYGASDELMECCITLGFRALDTRGNALETAQWMKSGDHKSLRLVTADWHMRRAALELANKIPPNITITRDAVRSNASLWTLLLEYHKFLAASVLRALA